MISWLETRFHFDLQNYTQMNRNYTCVSWFSRSWFTKSEDKVPKVPLLKYYTYNLGATAQVLSAGGPGLIAPGGTPGKIKLACARRYGVTFWRQIRSI